MSPVLERKKEGQDKPLLQLVSRAAAPLGVLAFWCGMLMAARFYPSGYDWRYLSVSKLASPEHNPAGYLWASAGIVICSLCGMYWSILLARSRDPQGRGGRPRGVRALQFGYVSMLCAAVTPQWLLRVERGHEILAALAFVGLLAGMVRLMFQTVERSLLGRMHSPGGHVRLYAFIAASVAVFPILLAGLAQAYFYYVPQEHQWSGFSWRVRGWPVLLRFAFWEWVTCVVLSAYMVSLPPATQADHRTGKTGEGKGNPSGS